LCLTKAVKNGRFKVELHQVIEGLSGFNIEKQMESIKQKVPFKSFFEKANVNSNAYLISGIICGYHFEEIENPLSQLIRYLDKLFDELTKGRKMDKILKSA
jgi:hypothetical protein